MFDAFNLYLEEKHSIYFSFKFGYFSIFSQRGFVLKEIKTVKKNGHDYYHFKSDRFKEQVFY